MSGGLQLGAALRGEAKLVSAREIEGYVFDPDDLASRLVVEFVVDGEPVSIARAERLRLDLVEEGFGDGCYGFSFALPATLVEADIALVRVANSTTLVGAPLRLAHSSAAVQDRGAARWLGGLAIGGWIEPSAPDSPAPLLRAVVDGETVAAAPADRWTHRERADRPAAVLGFTLRLPQRLADGRSHRAHILDPQGQPVPGSPCAFVAYPDGLAAALAGADALASEIPRGEAFDQCFPQSLPFDMVAEWRRRFPLVAPSGARKGPIAAVVIGEDGAETSLASLEAQRGCEWVATVLSEAGGGVGFAADELEAFLNGDGRDCAAVAFLRAGAVLEPEALAFLGATLGASPSSPFAYADVVLRDARGADRPIAHTAFDYERLLEQGYPVHLFVMRLEAVRRALEAGADDLFRLLTAPFDGAFETRGGREPGLAAAVPVHFPGFLSNAPTLDVVASQARLVRAARAHLDATTEGVVVEASSGDLSPAGQIRRPVSDAALTIVVATRNGAEWARRSSPRWLAETSGRDCEILIVSPDEALGDRPGGHAVIRHRKVAGPFRPETYANVAATAASGEFLLFLADDDEPASDGWLDELLGRMRGSEVGAVGPVLLAPEGFIACAGYAPAAGLSLAEAFEGHGGEAAGYADLLRVAHLATALPFNGLMTRRDLFRDLDGFDVVHFGRSFAAADYTLRLASRGRRILVAPAARLVSRAHLRARANGPAAERDRAQLRLRWGQRLLNDPSYSPLLALDGPPYSALAWPPRRGAFQTEARK